MHFVTKAAAVLAYAAYVEAFPAIAGLANGPRSTTPPEGNSGFFPNTVFNAKDQYVNVKPGSAHEFIAPKETDVRGPCPGLNAAANHGFISRTGVITLEDTTQGLQDAYNFGKDFSAPLFVFAVFNSGSFLNEEWSIGGPFKTADAGGLLGGAEGISNSHNKYEGDSSPGRGDAYLHNGDAHSLVISNYQGMYDLADKNGEFNFQNLRQHAVNAHEFSVKNNPYFFAGPVFFVPPIAHQFIAAMMSNHSAERIQGYLNKDILNSFFSVKETKNGLVWVPGHEQIPQNWYKRPSNNPYGIAASFADFGVLLANAPQIAALGGNTGKVNTFTGVDISDLTGGAFNAQTLLQGNNLACFAMQGTLVANPDALYKLEHDTSPFFAKAKGILEPLYKKLQCPQLTKFKTGMFEKYPGYTWTPPEQPATPY